MILYKYMSFDTAVSVVDNSTIGFSCLGDLNDPFEGWALCFKGEGGVSSSIKRGAFYNRLNRNYGVLSLTRAPLNALMWAHYGDEHRGVVLGFDIEKSLLNDASSCVIPAKFGDVIYTSTIPRNILPDSSIDLLRNVGVQSSSFFEENYELYKNSFLFKDSSWGYEEEVRVVKNISCSGRIDKDSFFDNTSGKWFVRLYQGRNLYCLAIPKESIVEAYLGYNIHDNIFKLSGDRDKFLKKIRFWRELGIDLKQIRKKSNSWMLEISDSVPYGQDID